MSALRFVRSKRFAGFAAAWGVAVLLPLIAGCAGMQSTSGSDLAAANLLQPESIQRMETFHITARRLQPPDLIQATP